VNGSAVTAAQRLVVGVQVGQARKAVIQGRSVLTAIHKQRVSGSVAVKSMGLEGDEQADLSVHGGLEKAIYAYPVEHYAFWQQARHEAGASGLGDELPYGSMGENLSLQGLLESDVWVGDVLRFAHCTLRVEQPREPCFKFNAAMGFSTAVKQMAISGFCGFYLSVDGGGEIAQGQGFELIAGPRRVSIPERFNARMFKHLR
jgi:MOSC domain-containing protein YiiM